jgi:hypothetical protein
MAHCVELQRKKAFIQQHPAPIAINNPHTGIFALFLKAGAGKEWYSFANVFCIEMLRTGKFSSRHVI